MTPFISEQDIQLIHTHHVQCKVDNGIGVITYGERSFRVSLLSSNQRELSSCLDEEQVKLIAQKVAVILLKSQILEESHSDPSPLQVAILKDRIKNLNGGGEKKTVGEDYQQIEAHLFKILNKDKPDVSLTLMPFYKPLKALDLSDVAVSVLSGFKFQAPLTENPLALVPYVSKFNHIRSPSSSEKTRTCKVNVSFELVEELLREEQKEFFKKNEMLAIIRKTKSFVSQEEILSSKELVKYNKLPTPKELAQYEKVPIVEEITDESEKGAEVNQTSAQLSLVPYASTSNPVLSLSSFERTTVPQINLSSEQFEALTREQQQKFFTDRTLAVVHRTESIVFSAMQGQGWKERELANKLTTVEEVIDQAEKRAQTNPDPQIQPVSIIPVIPLAEGELQQNPLQSRELKEGVPKEMAQKEASKQNSLFKFAQKVTKEVVAIFGNPNLFFQP